MTSLHIACLCHQESGVRQLVHQHIAVDLPVHLPICGDMFCVMDSIEQIRDLVMLRPTTCRKSSAIHCYQECSSFNSTIGSYGNPFSDESFDDNQMTEHSSITHILNHPTEQSQHYHLDGLTALHLSLLNDSPRCALLLLHSVSDLLKSSQSSPFPLQLTSLYSLAIFSYLPSHSLHQCFRKLPKLWGYFGSTINPSEDLIPFTLVNGLLTANYSSVINILSSQINLNSSCFSHIYSPLHIACVLLNESFIRLLLGYGADCRECTAEGDSCLHLIVKSEAYTSNPQLRSQLCGLLIMAGCDPLRKDQKGYSPLWYALRLSSCLSLISSSNDVYTVSVLLAYAPTLLTQHQGPFSRIPLHEALVLRRENLIRLFLKLVHSLINVSDGYGWYPFHYALNMGNWKLLVLLLNVQEIVSDGNIKDLVNACIREKEGGGRISRYVAEQICNQIECIRVSPIVCLHHSTLISLQTDIISPSSFTILLSLTACSVEGSFPF